MFSKKFICLIALLCLSLFLACGVGGGDDPEDDKIYTVSFPLMEGVTWIYNCSETDPDTQYVTTKVISGTVVFSEDTLGYVQPDYPVGLSWFRQVDQDSSFFLNDGDYVWMGEVNTTIEEFGGNPFVPFRVIPLEFAIGDTFTTLIHKQVGPLSADITFFITVIGVEDVTVPAGTFEDCLRLDAILAVSFGNDTILSTIWCADEVGLVKRDDYYESGSDHSYYEELTSYDVTP
ncbi:hypothetical protein KAH81_06950 [bacterium]|nr:hypothetical protein [bacterium]